jgi:predicted DCC family thiol-disulfide oxidoreductase YuxK
MTQPLRILYNDTCPICAREIGVYARADGAEDMQFCALNTAATFGLDADTAARRLHVVQDGQLIAGIDAFIAIWAALPAWAPLARIARLPLIRPVLGAAYDYILAPIIYRLHLRREKRRISRSE